MRCLAYCTSEAYQLSALSEFFKSHDYKLQQLQNVLHIQNSSKKQDVFLFQHGCFVAWGLSHTEEQKLLVQIAHFSKGILTKKESHLFVYKVAEKTEIMASFEGDADIISIAQEEQSDVLLKLAISYGCSQSVKLRTHELSIQKTVANNQPISLELANRGRISLSRKEIFKRIGEIFVAKSSVNLSNEYLDVSEYFWRYPHLEPYYLMVEKFLDIQKRVSILNQRLDVVHDTVIMLNNQLEHRYSSTLEIIIIVLIFGELLMNIMHTCFRL